MSGRWIACMLALGFAATPAAAFAQSSSGGDAAATGIALLFGVVSVVFFLFYGVALLVGICGFVLWVLMIVDVAQRTDPEFPGAMQGHPSVNERIIWLLVVLLGGVVGAVVYYFVVMRPYPRVPRPAP